MLLLASSPLQDVGGATSSIPDPPSQPSPTPRLLPPVATWPHGAGPLGSFMHSPRTRRGGFFVGVGSKQSDHKIDEVLGDNTCLSVLRGVSCLLIILPFFHFTSTDFISLRSKAISRRYSLLTHHLPLIATSAGFLRRGSPLRVYSSRFSSRL